MAPRIDRDKNIQPIHKKVEVTERQVRKPLSPPDRIEPKTADRFLFGAKQNDIKTFGAQQKGRIERLYGAGAASVSTMRDIALARATKKQIKAIQTNTRNN